MGFDPAYLTLCGFWGFVEDEGWHCIVGLCYFCFVFCEKEEEEEEEEVCVLCAGSMVC